MTVRYRQLPESIGVLAALDKPMPTRRSRGRRQRQRQSQRQSGFQTIPCFFSLLQKVLRGMPSRRAATLLLPLASFKASMSRWRS